MNDIGKRLCARRMIATAGVMGVGRTNATNAWLTEEPDPDCVEAANLIEYLRNDIHSCGPTCSRAGCVNGRLRAALQKVVALTPSNYKGWSGAMALDDAWDAACEALESTK
jgi:hypothetical protein